MGDFRVHHVRFFEYKPKAIHCLAYEPESKRLAVSRSDGSVEIWSEQDNWYQERVIPASGDRSVEALLWQGRRLFTAGLDGEVTEYDLIKLKAKYSTFSHAGPIWCLALNSDETRIAAGTEEGCVVLFDIEMENLHYIKAFDRQEGRILSIAWHEAENTIVTGGVDNIRLWSTGSGHAVQRLMIGRDEVSKETIIWCVAVTSDLIVISGDSRGKTCFWNGKMGTLLKSFQSHKADVLSLCLNQTGDSVFTVGVDPTVVQFDKVHSGPEESQSRWTRTVVRSVHTHDIRAVALAGNKIITGGVDTSLVFHNIRHGNHKKGRRVAAIPQHSVIHVAKDAGLVMLQYTTQLEVWRLGSTKRTSDRHGDILPLDSKPVKIVQLRARIGDCIVCSAISSDGLLIAYSDERNIRLYSLSLQELDSLEPLVSMNRIKITDEEIMAAHRMAFTSRNQLITATCGAAVQVLEVNVSEVKVNHIFQPLKDEDSIHLLAVSSNGEHVAVADHKKRIKVYNIVTQQMCDLPSQSTQPCAMTFSSNSTELCVVYCDRSIFEYDVNKCELTSWSRSCSRQLPGQWKERKSIPLNVTVNPRDPDQYLVHDEEIFCIVDKTKPISVDRKKGEATESVDLALKFCSKYKYLLHLDALHEDWLVAVELTPVSITESLPATLRQKKFGT